MSDEKKSPIQQVLDELRDPWDWTAALVGAAGGAAVTIFAHGADLGHSIPTGALTAIAGRRSVVSGLSRSRLRKKAHNLLAMLAEDRPANDVSITELEEYLKKWDKKIIPSEALEKKIDQLAEQDTERKISSIKHAKAAAAGASTPPKRRITFDDV